MPWPSLWLLPRSRPCKCNLGLDTGYWIVCMMISYDIYYLFFNRGHKAISRTSARADNMYPSKHIPSPPLSPFPLPNPSSTMTISADRERTSPMAITKLRDPDCVPSLMLMEEDRAWMSRKTAGRSSSSSLPFLLLRAPG